jgi:hypothetical protein
MATRTTVSPADVLNGDQTQLDTEREMLVCLI